MHIRFVPLLLLVPSLVLAQPSSVVDDGDLSRGLTLPPTTAALTDEVTSLVVNPAGLSQLKAFQLFYLHERSLTRDLVVDGLFVGDRFGPVGLGLGFEWVRSSTNNFFTLDRRRTTWGLSLGSQAFSLGGSLGFYSSDIRFLDDALSIDLGLMIRPNDYVSFGATMRNVDEPTERLPPGFTARGPFELPRTYELALGLRPIGNRLTASVAYFARGDDFGAGRMNYVLQAEALRGLVFGAGVSHAIAPVGDVAVQLSASFNLPNVGLTYAVGTNRDDLDHVIQVRISGDDYPGLSPGRKVALIDLPTQLSTVNPTSVPFIGGSGPDAYLRLMQLLAHAERDTSLSAVVFKFEGLPEFGLARAEELRQAIVRLRASGKKVIAVLFTASDAEYLSASAADQIYVVPQSMLLVNGLAASVLYLGEAMDKLGIDWQVARVGEYKNAPDQLTRRDMSPEQRKTIDAYLDDQYDHLVRTLAEMRKLTPDRVQEILREGLITPQRAIALGMVDGVIDPAEFEQKLREHVPGGTFSGNYTLPGPQRDGWGRRPTIAVVPVIGTIASGKSRNDPFGLAEVAGAESVVRALTEAAADPSVKAIVLRVDSGGGDALASDLMYRAVLEARKKKPVIASMGDVAASGGYYAAMGAQSIFADPTTLTGSIGVFVIKPALQPLANKLGIQQETIRRGDVSTIFGSFHPWSPQEEQAVQKWVDSFYEDFIGEVAKQRKLSRDEVDAIARGRVWSGTDAAELKLVDQLGTFLDAVDAARGEAGLSAGEDFELRIYQEEGGLLSALVDSPLARSALPDPTPSPWLELAKKLGIPSPTLLEPGMKAQLPFQIRLE